MSICQLHLKAFGETEGDNVSQLVLDLFEDKTALPILSLVAEINNDVVGHIFFSSVNVAGVKVSDAYILAPLAVSPHFQRGGIGESLINRGLEVLKARKASFVLVYGNPKYYCRTGFKSKHDIKPPYKLAYPEAWMVQELKTGALLKIKGTVQCAASLSKPALW
jgi:predicted N-acetyltransferase YhbS